MAQNPGAKNQTTNPGDEAKPGTGENVCPRCRGTGKVEGAACPDCGGSGKITEGIGGG